MLRNLRNHVVFGLALVGGCATAGSPADFDSLASAVGSADFGVRILVAAGPDSGSCFEFDETQGPAPWFVALGVRSAHNVAACGSPFFGPYAEGSVSVSADREGTGAPKTAWRLNAAAVSSGKGYAESNVNVLDSFRILTTGTNQAQVYLHVEVEGQIAGNPSNSGLPLAEYEFFTQFVRKRQDGTFERLLRGTPVFHRTDANYDEAVDLDLPPLESGSEIIMNSGFLFALAVSNGFSVQSAGATAELSLCSRDPKVTIVSASGLTGKCPSEGDLRIASISVIQSVPDADLVAGKDTVVQVDIVSTFKETVDAEIEFSIEQPSIGPPRTFSEMITIPANCPGPKRYYFPQPIDSPDECATSPTAHGLVELGMEPRFGGIFTVKATLTPENPDSDPENDTASSPLRVVKETSLLVSYVRIECNSPGCYGSVSDPQYAQAIDWVNAIAPAIFPVTPATFAGTNCTAGNGGCVVAGSMRGNPGIDLTLDVRNAFFLGVKERPLTRSVLAFIPKNYLATHHIGGCGWTPLGPNGLKVSLVSASQLDCMPNESGVHELIHQYQPFTTQQDDVLSHPSTTPEGYFVGCPVVHRTLPEAEVFGVDFSMNTFSCEVPKNSVNLLAHTSLAALPKWAPVRWLDRTTYAHAVNALKNNPDPEILLVDGQISTTGVVEFGKWVQLAGGRTDHSAEPGEYAYRLLDSAGAVVHEETFPVVFLAITDAGVVPTSAAAISMRLPYPREVARVQFLKNGVVLADHDPLVKTLRDAVAAVPDRAYSKQPAERRNALLNKVGAFEKMMTQKNRTGALQKLRQDIQPHVGEWMVGHDKESPVEFTKAELLDLINQIAARLEIQAKP